MRRRFPHWLVQGVVLACVLIPSNRLWSQQPVVEDDLGWRVQQLERELALLRQGAGPLPDGTVTPAQTPQQADMTPTAWELNNTEAANLEPSGQPVPSEWRKGDFTIKPYGRITVSTVYETQRSFAGDYILYVESPDKKQGDGFYIDPKTTRLGLDVAGPQVPALGAAAVGARVEIDFQGQYAYPNKPGVLFRQAYLEVKNEQYRILAGQAWDVISPLYPGNLNYVPGSGVGSLGYRRPQLRAERYLELNPGSKLTLQGSLNRAVQWNYPSDPDVRPGSSGWPILQGRVALTRENWYAGPAELGVSSHYGEEDYDFLTAPKVANLSRRTYSLNVDLKVPLTTRIGVQGEFFTGENLTDYHGGIYQGVDRLTRATIGSTGGWVDLWYDWSLDWHSHFGYALDDPWDDTLTSGRTYNHMLFGNLIWDITKKFNLGCEVSSWRTLWMGLRPGEETRLELQANYNF